MNVGSSGERDGWIRIVAGLSFRVMNAIAMATELRYIVWGYL